MLAKNVTCGCFGNGLRQRFIHNGHIDDCVRIAGDLEDEDIRLEDIRILGIRAESLSDMATVDKIVTN